MVELRALRLDDGAEMYGMLQELPPDENGFLNPVYGVSYDEYRQWLVQCVADAEQVGLLDGWMVPQSTFWFYADGRLAGMGKIRHFLTDRLRQAGGTIGYALRPSERGKGLGTLFLAELVMACKKLGVDRVLLTINKDNIPSVKSALANRGIIEAHHLQQDTKALASAAYGPAPGNSGSSPHCGTESAAEDLYYIWIDCEDAAQT